MLLLLANLPSHHGVSAVVVRGAAAQRVRVAVEHGAQAHHGQPPRVARHRLRPGIRRDCAVTAPGPGRAGQALAWGEAGRGDMDRDNPGPREARTKRAARASGLPPHVPTPRQARPDTRAKGLPGPSEAHLTRPGQPRITRARAAPCEPSRGCTGAVQAGRVGRVSARAGHTVFGDTGGWGWGGGG